ncbi:endolytic transglycosylase MltG [Sediminibacterium soli]|uniref:endolytic transglycosylase MltG n=1 Tax=Sediminibacterium soli TaxID=2698829 RepID=UPI00137997FD|nr:endolytic transglycosylase MltG [Sediminibacterium soli]NCI46017.1 endolytic transglycosylase MltG [Sediminibacterium soli]
MARFLTILVILLLLAAGLITWKVLGPATDFPEKSHSFIIEEEQTDRASVTAVLKKNGIIGSAWAFSLVASRMHVWDKIRPGKYEVKKGENALNIARMLKNGKLAEYKLVINRIRLKEDLARLIGKNFRPDSASVMKFLGSKDSLKPFGVDTGSVFTLMIPDTYQFYWNTSVSRILRRLSDAKEAFWKRNNRQEKAKALGLSAEQVYILASIVDEETNFESDKYKIASVYLNRLHTGMPLQACPTIKYAMRNFALTRIYEKYLVNPSPYNTYRHKGLPPGPICTPSPKTIDIILDAPKTDYLYFVAKSDFSGYHHFSSNYDEHNTYAKAYQKALDAYMARKQQNL